MRRMLLRSSAGVLAVLLLGWSGPETVSAGELPKCLFVSSYHKGYAWSDGVERGLRSTLQGRCEIRQFDMDTKRRKSAPEKRQSALEAKAIIESWQPDIVITADDNAAKYLIKPYYKDHALPFVFCGVNWTVEEYGFPYANVTGMIEIAPIVPMLSRARDLLPSLRRAFYLGPKTLTGEKNLQRVREAAHQIGIHLDSALVPTTEEWLEAYERAQESDLVILGSNAGIDDWDETHMIAAVQRRATKLSVTNHEWMMPYAMLGMTKVPEEHGEWAAKVALSILGGMSPREIPIIANSRHDLWVNHSHVSAAGVQLPQGLVRRAKRVAAIEPRS